MRTIKFRGLRTDGKGWVYGYYYEYSGKHIICWQNHSDNATTDYFAEVIPETVGQFTGLYDKDGKEIFEGDLLKVQDPYNGNWSTDSAPVIFSKDYVGGWVISSGNQNLNLGSRQQRLEIIGEIHTNPELL